MYDLELDKVVEKIKKEEARTVLLQLPDGLKNKATEIVDYLKSKVKVDIIIWADTCFGSCDTPNIEVDLLIQFGHSEWK